jgi:hypothetical protein
MRDSIKYAEIVSLGKGDEYTLEVVVEPFGLLGADVARPPP